MDTQNEEDIYLWDWKAIVKFRPRTFEQLLVTKPDRGRTYARIVYLKGKQHGLPK